MSRFRKDPDATLDYSWDWSQWLQNGETIASAQIIADVGITVGSTTTGVATVVAWLSGGTVGQTYTVTCRVTTSNTPARIDDWSIYVNIRQK